MTHTIEITAYTPAMLAERWACSERHVRNMIDRGDIPSFRLGGKLLRILVKDIEEYECRNGASHGFEESSPSPSTERAADIDTHLQPMTRAKLSALRLHSSRS